MAVCIPTRSPKTSLLACPICHGALSPDLTHCARCAHRFPQADGEPLTLWPESSDSRQRDVWAFRQRVMERDYQDFVADPSHVARAYEHDGGAFREWLSACAGEILDVGGGNGLLRHYLPPQASYTVVDPSLMWFGQEWGVLEETFPCLSEPLPFVRGVAEALPFRSGAFDWVLAFWSLNHVDNPAQACAEMGRVLRSGGRALLVLEDMRPEFRAVWHGHYRDHRWTRAGTLWRRALSPLLGWPLQPDHVRIEEAALRTACASRFRLARREWKGSYLALELESV